MLPTSGPLFRVFLWVPLGRVSAETSAGTLADEIGTRFLESNPGTILESAKTAENDASDHRFARSSFGSFGTPRESASHHVKPKTPKSSREVP